MNDEIKKDPSDALTLLYQKQKLLHHPSEMNLSVCCDQRLYEP